MHILRETYFLLERESFIALDTLCPYNIDSRAILGMERSAYQFLYRILCNDLMQHIYQLHDHQLLFLNFSFILNNIYHSLDVQQNHNNLLYAFLLMNIGKRLAVCLIIQFALYLSHAQNQKVNFC